MVFEEILKFDFLDGILPQRTQGFLSVRFNINAKFAKLYLKTLRTLRNSLRTLRLKKPQHL